MRLDSAHRSHELPRCRRRASSLARPRLLLVPLLAAAPLAGIAAALAPQLGQESWVGPFEEWFEWDPESCEDQEFAHAALIPVGALQGKVLLWKNRDNCAHRTQTWVFEPDNPDELVEVPTTVDSNIFCSGISWNGNGHLLITGGVPINHVGIPSATYRFIPHNVSGLKVDKPPAAPYYQPTTEPWVPVGDTSIPHFYPTLVPLNKRSIHSGSTLVGTLELVSKIHGGGHLLLGGPSIEEPIGETINDGNELWQVFDPVIDNWSHTLVSDTPLYTFTGVREEYLEKPDPQAGEAPGSLVEQLLDSYPRAFQLADPDPDEANIAGQVFVANDVDTDFDLELAPPSTPGVTWVIKPPSASPEGRWEMWHGAPETLDPGDCPGDVPPNCYKDRFFGTAVLMHMLGQPNRVLVFGGSQNPGHDPEAEPIACPVDWRVNSSVWEWGPASGGGNRVVQGSWNQKASLATYPFGRVVLNAVILPTGQILIVGGDRVDGALNHNDDGENPCTSGPDGSDPVFEPELYDPGQDALVSGSTRLLMPNVGNEIPRLYHSLAVLLPDCSVLIAGGDGPESAYTGEFLRPPYLDLGAQPVITSAPMSVDFTTDVATPEQFEVDVTVFHEAIDKVVLLRPAALTHHCDMDQRYIELDWAPDPENPPYLAVPPFFNGAGTLIVDAPAETMGPPGYYMLFVVEDTDTGSPSLEYLVPSNAHFIRLE